MTITTSPPNYASAFCPACFALAGIPSGGVDIEILSPSRPEPLGVKRLYAMPIEPYNSLLFNDIIIDESLSTASLNIAPYARRLLTPTPLCGLGAGLHIGAGRTATCYISAPAGFRSESVMLCAGTEDAPPNTLLSAAPPTVRIALGEFDELPVTSQDTVSAVVDFSHGGTTYTDLSIGRRNAPGILSAVVDTDAISRSFSALTGVPPEELTEFTVRLQLSESGFTDRTLQRRYIVDHNTQTGRRLAWVNRFGAVDYHTFPTADELRSGGSHATIETSSGPRTVSTASRQSARLLSGPCDVLTAEWLSEIFSSPAVWTVDGSQFEQVEVAPGETTISPTKPTTIAITLFPISPNISRKF
ncbi:MAG: hypothetical protein LBV38_01975 [Alistipes sp.]|jgi:hypothetical protein|nr:hypothetical protein [Alistipes sp.]